MQVPPVRTSTQTPVPPVIHKAVENARAECEAGVTQWFSMEAWLLGSLEMEATDAGVSVTFPGKTTMARCMTRKLASQRFDVGLESPKVSILYLGERKPLKTAGSLPEAAELMALLQKCGPKGTPKSSFSIRITAEVRGTAVVIDRPVLESKDLDAWARSCIELGLMRAVPFDKESRPFFESVTIDMASYEGGQPHSSMTYKP